MIHHVFANRSNAGDWLSAIGIQRALGTPPVVEHLCDEPFVPDTLAALQCLDEGDVLLIGGGGLLMDYFSPFWEGLANAAPEVPVCVWGIGLCDLKKEKSRPPGDLIRAALRPARYNSVRDARTRDFLGALGIDACIVPCPSLYAVDPPPAGGRGVLHVDNYSTVGAQAYEAMCIHVRDFAERTGRACRRQNNRIERPDEQALREVLASYAKSDVVVSSALHGCIIAVAMGLPVVAVSGDFKIDEFMRSAGLGEWVIDADDVERLPSLLSTLADQPAARAFTRRAREVSLEVAREVRRIAGGPSGRRSNWPGV